MLNRVSLVLLACPLFAPIAAGQICNPELTQNVPAFQSFFGGAVDISADIAVVGAPRAPDGTMCAGNPGGTATVFRLVGGQWVSEAELTSPNGQCDGNYGSDVAIDGDRIVVGAPFEDHSGLSYAGRAYAYEQIGGIWTLTDTFTESQPFAGGLFGYSVDVNGDRMAIAASRSALFGFNEGAVYVYGNNLGAWIPEATVGPTGTAAGTAFGTSVAIFGDVLAVGAVFDSEFGNQVGAAYVFRRQVNTTWPLEVKLTPPVFQPLSYYGISVDVRDDEFLVVGAEGASNGASNSGSAFVYRNQGGGAWSLEAELGSPAPVANGTFGRAVSYADERVLVTDVSTPGGGAAFVYERVSATQWDYVRTLRAPSQGPGDGYGVEASLVGDLAIVSAPLRSTSAPISGAAYVYDLTTQDCNGNGIDDVCDLVPEADLNGNMVLDECESIGMSPNCQTVPNSTGAVARLIAVGSAALADNDVTLLADRLPADAFGYPIVSMTSISTIPSNSAGYRCVGGSIGRDFANLFNSGLNGTAVLPIDLTAIPRPVGAMSASVGQTWYWQLWHRDSVGGASTSTFSDSRVVMIE